MDVQGPILQMIINAFAFSFFGALVGAPIMKFYERKIPIWRHALICFWAFLRGMIIITFLYFVWILILRQSYKDFPSISQAAVMLGIGYLISSDLKSYGVIRNFPGIGARVIFGFVICFWAISSLWLSFSQ